jgi:hypothetical protein
MGELQHGTYDDECEGLTLEEVNAFYDFGEDGERQADEDSNKSNEGQNDSDDNYEEIEADMELDEPGPGSGNVIGLEHEVDMEVCVFMQ